MPARHTLELLSCTGFPRLWTVQICELHIFFFPPASLPLPLLYPRLLGAFENSAGKKGSSSQSKWTFKVDALFHACFPQIPSRLATVSASHPNHSVPRQTDGLTCQLPVEKPGHSYFMSSTFIFFYKVKQGGLKGKHRCRRQVWVSCATHFKMKSDIYPHVIRGFNRNEHK